MQKKLSKPKISKNLSLTPLHSINIHHSPLSFLQSFSVWSHGQSFSPVLALSPGPLIAEQLLCMHKKAAPREEGGQGLWDQEGRLLCQSFKLWRYNSLCCAPWCTRWDFDSWVLFVISKSLKLYCVWGLLMILLLFFFLQGSWVILPLVMRNWVNIM